MINLDNPAQQQIDVCLTRLNSASEQFAAARAQVLQLETQLANQQQAAEAAEANANTAKQSAASLLRQLVGKPTKELLGLRADERAAYSLAEDYRHFANELQTSLEASRDTTRDEAEKVGNALQELTATYASIAMAQVADTLQPLLYAIYLKSRAYGEQGRFGNWAQRGHEKPSEAALADAYQLILEQYRQATFTLKDDPVWLAARIPTGLDDFPPLTPMQKHVRAHNHTTPHHKEA